MRTLLSFAALLLSVTLVQLGSGVLGPLDALAGRALMFTSGEIGFLGSAHFLGFFIGCWATPRLMGAVGHSRAFAALAAVGAISALLHPVLQHPVAWAVLRVGSGVAVAGAYTVVESWMQAKVTNATRGRVLGVYRIVDMSAAIGAQGLVAVLDPGSYVAYNIIAVICCLTLLPLALTTSKPPPAPATPRLRPLRVMLLSPFAATTVITTGLTNSSFRMVGPLYALDSGLAVAEVALFMAAGIAGGALAQWPAGWLSDKFNRRWVVIGLSGGAILVSSAIIIAGSAVSGAMAYAAIFAFGFMALPMYSIAVAHANDFAKPEEIVELNAALMFLYAVGAIVSPFIAASLIEAYGAPSLFIYIAAAHILLILFSLWRMTRRALSTRKTAHVYVPRTSFTIARFFKGAKRDGGV